MSDAQQRAVAVWRRIEAWLGQHSPAGLASLGGPAGDEGLRKCEEGLGVPLPEETRASYRVHDGQVLGRPFLLGDWQLLTLEEVVGQWRTMNALEETAGWHPGLIPLFTNGGGDFYCLDRAGQILPFLHTDGPREPMAAGLLELLEHYAGELEAGAFFDDDGWLVRR